MLLAFLRAGCFLQRMREPLFAEFHAPCHLSLFVGVFGGEDDDDVVLRVWLGAL